MLLKINTACWSQHNVVLIHSKCFMNAIWPDPINKIQRKFRLYYRLWPIRSVKWPIVAALSTQHSSEEPKSTLALFIGSGPVFLIQWGFSTKVSALGTPKKLHVERSIFFSWWERWGASTRTLQSGLTSRKSEAVSRARHPEKVLKS